MMPADTTVDTTGDRRAWMALAVAWTAVFGGIALWLGLTSTGSLVEQLKVLQFWSLDACVFVLAVCLVLLARELRRDLNRSHLLVMGLMALTSLLLTLGVAPRTNRIFYDEQIYSGGGAEHGQSAIGAGLQRRQRGFRPPALRRRWLQQTTVQAIRTF
ncbi:MAG: DUF4149 domain-containing protein [Vicinamibacterales bacterium]